jgi:UDP-glucose 4-epimerase
VSFIQGTLLNSADLAQALVGVDAVMHFAGKSLVGESVEKPDLYHQVNVDGTRNLLDEMHKSGVKKLVFSSSAATYGEPEQVPILESAPTKPTNPYGATKLAIDQMITAESAARGIAAASLRYFNVAGADPQGRTGQSTPNATHLIKVACQVATGQRPSMEVFGTDYDTPDGTCVRDYIHVSDLADAHVLLAQHLLAGGANVSANCGYGKGASVLEVLASLEKQLNHPIAAKMSPRRAGDAPSLVANSAHLKSLVPWQPKFEELDDIVAAALAWERHLVASGGLS